MPDLYTDLTVRLRDQVADGPYRVEARLDDGRSYENGRLALDAAALSANELNPAEYGRLLFDALFAGEIRRAYDTAAARAEAVTQGRLRLRLQIDAEAAELHAMPWERLYRPAPGGQLTPLTTHIETPFSRYTSLDIPEPAPLAERPIRLLAVLANPDKLPEGLAPADAETEINSLRQALGDPRHSPFQVTFLPGRSPLSAGLRAQLQAEGYRLVDGPASLDNVLAHLAGQHILHYIGHGAFSRLGARGQGTARLFLEKPEGGPQPVKDDDLIARLAGNLPRLVFLVACESAKRDPAAEDAFVGLGPKLVRAGAPAVVAMQAEVPVETARKLAAEFYRRLAEHGEVDKALAQARWQTFDPQRTDWAIPVLFSRLETGALFTVGGAAPAESAAASSGRGGLSIKAGGGVTAGGDIVGGDKITGAAVAPAGPTAGQGSGGLSIDAQGEVTAGGDIVGGDKVSAGETAPTQSWVVLDKQLAKALAAVDGLVTDEDTQLLVKNSLGKIGPAIKANNLTELETRLKKIQDLSPDVLKKVVNAITNVAVRAPEPVLAVARKFASGQGA